MLKANSMCMPVNHAVKDTPMNSAIFVRVTGTPTARALGADAADREDPVAGPGAQQDPRGDRDEQRATTARVMLNCTPPIVEVGGETACACANPSMSAIEVGGDVAGDQLGEAEVEPGQHEERAERDDEARQPGLDVQQAVDEAERQRDHAARRARPPRRSA